MSSILSQDTFLGFGYISLYKTCAQRVAPFLNQATFYKLGKVLLDDNSYQISRLFASSGPDKRQCKDYWGEVFFGPRAILSITR